MVEKPGDRVSQKSKEVMRTGESHECTTFKDMMNKIKGILISRPARKVVLGSRSHVRLAHVGPGYVGVMIAQSASVAPQISVFTKDLCRGAC